MSNYGPEQNQGTQTENGVFHPDNYEKRGIPPAHQRDDNPEVQKRIDLIAPQQGQTPQVNEGRGGNGNIPPHDPIDFNAQPQPTPEKQRKFGRRAVLAGGLAAAGAALAGGLFIGLKPDHNEATPDPRPTAAGPANPNTTAPSGEAKPSSEASSSPSAEKSLSPEEQKVKDFELPANATEQELGGKMWQDRMTEWQNAGATPDLALQYERSNLPVADADEKFLDPLAEQNAKSFADALFPKGWEDDPMLAKFANGMRKSNLATLKLYVRTYTDGHVEKWAYHEWDTVDGEVAVSNQDEDAGTATITTPMMQHDNSNENRAQYYAQGKLKVDGNTYTSVMNIKREKDRTVITKVSLA